MSPPLLSARELHLSYGAKPVLQGVTFEVRAGETVALCGPNGSGKSTLLRLLAAERRPDRGQLLFDGRPLDQWPRRALARRRAVLPQDLSLSFPFEARQVVSMGRLPHADAGGHGQIAVDRALSRLGITHLARRLYPTLSGGERQRVQLARILAQLDSDEPGERLLLLDEPTSALDLLHQQTVLQAARHEARARQTAVVAAIHDLNLASAWADRILLLHGGVIHAAGHPDDVVETEVLSRVYGVATHLLRHPVTGRPVVVHAQPGAHP